MRNTIQYKSDILELTKGVLGSVSPNEVPIFNEISESLFDNIIEKSDSTTLAQSESGIYTETIMTLLLLIITTGVSELAKEGVGFSKFLLKRWLKDNKDRLIDNSRSERIDSLIDSLIKYLDEN